MYHIVVLSPNETDETGKITFSTFSYSHFITTLLALRCRYTNCKVNVHHTKQRTCAGKVQIDILSTCNPHGFHSEDLALKNFNKWIPVIHTCLSQLQDLFHFNFFFAYYFHIDSCYFSIIAFFSFLFQLHAHIYIWISSEIP
jgi:hypothetical protein